MQLAANAFVDMIAPTPKTGAAAAVAPSPAPNFARLLRGVLSEDAVAPLDVLLARLPPAQAPTGFAAFIPLQEENARAAAPPVSVSVGVAAPIQPTGAAATAPAQQQPQLRGAAQPPSFSLPQQAAASAHAPAWTPPGSVATAEPTASAPPPASTPPGSKANPEPTASAPPPASTPPGSKANAEPSASARSPASTPPTFAAGGGRTTETQTIAEPQPNVGDAIVTQSQAQLVAVQTESAGAALLGAPVAPTPQTFTPAASIATAPVASPTGAKTGGAASSIDLRAAGESTAAHSPSAPAAAVARTVNGNADAQPQESRSKQERAAGAKVSAATAAAFLAPQAAAPVRETAQPGSTTDFSAQVQAAAPAGGAAQGVQSAAMHDQVVRAAPAAVQVAREIVRRFDGDSTRFELRLDPPELGRIEVRLDVTRDHRVTAVVSADTPQALTELSRHARELEQTLQSAGLQLNENGLSFDLRQSRGEAAEHEAKQSAGGVRDDGEIVDAAPLSARPVGLERWRGVRLDMMV